MRRRGDDDDDDDDDDDADAGGDDGDDYADDNDYDYDCGDDDGDDDEDDDDDDEDDDDDVENETKKVYENGPRFGAGFRDGNKRTARAHGTVRELSLSAVFGARSRPQNWGRVVARSSSSPIPSLSS